jgi:sodium-coupled neutral amino acid transporter 11
MGFVIHPLDPTCCVKIANIHSAFGGMIAFCIIVGDTIPHVMSALFPSLEDSHFLWLLTDRKFVIVVFIMAISYPFSLYRDISKVGRTCFLLHLLLLIDIIKLAKASSLALFSMLIIVITVITQGPRVPAEMKGPIKGSLIINNGVFQAIGVISFGKYLINHALRSYI